MDRWVTGGHDTVKSARLQTIRAGLRTIASGTGMVYATSTDGKQVAVLRNDGSVGLYSTAGRLLHAVTPSPPPIYAQCRGAWKQGVAVRGHALAVLTRVLAAKSTLEVYNSHSGKLLHEWPVAKGASYLAVSSGLADYAAFRGGGGLYALRTIHVLNLSTGKDRIVANIALGAPGVVGLQLDPIGLAYAVNHTIGGGPGLVVFKPMAELR